MINYATKFNKLVEKLEKQGYEFDYNDTSGEFIFKKYIFNEVEEIEELWDTIRIQDRFNEKTEGTDWKKAYNDLKKYVKQ